MVTPFGESEHDVLEAFAGLTVHGLLLEVIYANAFSTDVKGFQELMGKLQRLVTVADSQTQSISTELRVEMQARVATHLQLFSRNVQRRIESAEESSMASGG